MRFWRKFWRNFTRVTAYQLAQRKFVRWWTGGVWVLYVDGAWMPVNVQMKCADGTRIFSQFLDGQYVSFHETNMMIKQIETYPS